MNRASKKLFLESIKLLETVISSLVRLWTLLNNVYFGFNSVLHVTSNMENDVHIHIAFDMGIKDISKSVQIFL